MLNGLSSITNEIKDMGYSLVLITKEIKEMGLSLYGVVKFYVNILQSYLHEEFKKIVAKMNQICIVQSTDQSSVLNFIYF